MAINNWRQTVTWWQTVPERFSPLGYRIVPPTVNNANTATPTQEFTPAEVYWFKADWYYNQGDTAMADAYRSIANDLWSYSGFANQSVDAADALLNYIRENEAGLQSVAGNLYGQLTWDIQKQRDYINQMFWPEWELTKEINTYYTDLWNYLSSEAGREAAKIAAQWIHSGASLGAIRAQENEAYNQAFARYIQAREQQINAKQQLAANLINYMSTLRQEYWDTTNQYVIDLYKRANDMYNSIAQSVADDINTYNRYKIQASSSKWTSPTGLYPFTTYDEKWNPVTRYYYQDINWTWQEYPQNPTVSPEDSESNHIVK